MQKYCGYCGNKKADKGVLYHFTNAHSILGILNSNILRGTKAYGDPIKGVSTTRDSSLHFSKVRIALNGNKIARTHKIKLYDYIYNEEYGRAVKEYGDNPKSINKLLKDKNFGRSEREEVIVGDISNLHEYILAIDIDSFVPQERRRLIASAIQAYRETHGVNFPVNIVGDKLFKAIRDQYGNIPSRFDKYKEDPFEWLAIEDIEEPFSEDIVEDTLDTVIKRIEEFKHTDFYSAFSSYVADKYPERTKENIITRMDRKLSSRNIEEDGLSSAKSILSQIYLIDQDSDRTISKKVSPYAELYAAASKLGDVLKRNESLGEEQFERLREAARELFYTMQRDYVAWKADNT